MTMYNPALRADRSALASALVHALDAHGFTRVAGSGEWVYGRATPERHVEVRVYTTIEGGIVRAVASDAIRVCLVYADGRDERGLCRLPRVFRVGEIEGIVERTLARMHDAAGRVSALRSCGRCGAPMFLTKRNTYACAALCFKAVAPPAPVAPVPVAVPMVKAAPVVRVETTPPTPTPKPFRDPFATRTLADVLRGQASVAVPVKPAPCVDGWEHYGAKEEP